MSQAIADSIMASIQDNIDLLKSMMCIYPGDPSGNMTLDCLVMEEIIADINEYNWDLVREELRAELPKVTITYD